MEKLNTVLAKEINQILVERTIPLEESLPSQVSRVRGKPLVMTRIIHHWQDRLGFALH